MRRAVIRHTARLARTAEVTRTAGAFSTAPDFSARSRFHDRRTLDFLLHDVLALRELAPRYDGLAELGDDGVGAILDAAERFVEAHHEADAHADAHEPYVDAATRRVVVPASTKAANDAYVDGGFMAASVPVAHGGLGLPFLASAAVSYVVSTGFSSSTLGYWGLTAAAANLLREHGSAEQIATFHAPMVEGRWTGTMALSETQAGSSLADVACKAAPTDAAAGVYALTGSKMWTSGGDHELYENIVHFVLAKIDAPDTPPGVRGLSLFIVPKYLVADPATGALGARNDWQLDGLNHKMGQRGLANAYWSLGDRGGAVGYLVGAPHSGLANMFFMMNEMRVAVGISAAAAGARGFAESLRYSAERAQGRPLGAKDPTAPQVPIVAHADVRRMLLLQKVYAEGSVHLCLYGARLVDDAAGDGEAAARARLLLEFLTPIVKSWPAEWALEANKWGLQVLGGYGYTRDYPLERLYRDNRLNMIHEGSHGIQALDLLGRKALMRDGAATRAVVGAIAACAAEVGAKPAAAELAPLAAELDAAATRLGATTMALAAAAAAKDGPELALANAHEYLNMAGHTVVAWLWLQQAAVAAEQLAAGGAADEAFLKGKIEACKFFFRHELPKTRAQAKLLGSLDDTTLRFRPEWF